MFEQLKEVSGRLEEIVRLLSDPECARDPARLQALMKEQASLLPVAQAYSSWQKACDTIEECGEMLTSFFRDLRAVKKARKQAMACAEQDETV